jgi:hypothetical protein
LPLTPQLVCGQYFSGKSDGCNILAASTSTISLHPLHF